MCAVTMGNNALTQQRRPEVAAETATLIKFIQSLSAGSASPFAFLVFFSLTRGIRRSARCPSTRD